MLLYMNVLVTTNQKPIIDKHTKKRKKKENIISILFDIGLSNIVFGYVSSGKGNKSKNKQMGLKSFAWQKKP